jgi:hypothetical protein
MIVGFSKLSRRAGGWGREPQHADVLVRTFSLENQYFAVADFSAPGLASPNRGIAASTAKIRPVETCGSIEAPHRTLI